MKYGSKITFVVFAVAAELASVTLAGGSASAQATISRQVKHQKRLLQQQRQEIERNERVIDAQRRQLAGAVPGAGLLGGPYTGNPYGFGYYDRYGCPPGTGYSIFLGRCGDLSEFFTQFQGR